jgi:hypothetical protein
MSERPMIRVTADDPILAAAILRAHARYLHEHGRYRQSELRERTDALLADLATRPDHDEGGHDGHHR